MPRTDCSKYESEWLRAAPDVEALPPAARAHLGTCVPCATRFSRLATWTRVMRSLPRASVPAELDGRVVAALHAGHRQERALARLESLGRRRPPGALERALQADLAGEVGRAPQALDDRVAAQLGGGAPGFVSARALARLARVPAPPELARAVADEIERRPVSPLRVRSSVAALLAAALVLFLTFGRGRLASDPAVGPRPAEYSFDVRYHDDFRALDATARGWVDGITGGLSRALLPR